MTDVQIQAGIRIFGHQYISNNELCLYCPGQDLNLHALRRYHLKVVRLPIPPPGRSCGRVYAVEPAPSNGARRAADDIMHGLRELAKAAGKER
jgi:hypothetical protein